MDVLYSFISVYLVFFLILNFFFNSVAPPGTFLAQNLDQAIDMTQNGSLKDKTEQIFIIGGSSVYKVIFSVI